MHLLTVLLAILYLIAYYVFLAYEIVMSYPLSLAVLANFITMLAALFVFRDSVPELALSKDSLSHPYAFYTFNFLHANFLHLIANMMGLAYLGRRVLPVYDHKLQMAILFVLPFFVGVGTWVLNTIFSPDSTALTVGYSGVIMALVGLFIQQRQSGWITLLVEIIIWHAAFLFFDLHISFSAHATGFLCGYMAGKALITIQRRYPQLCLIL